MYLSSYLHGLVSCLQMSMPVLNIWQLRQTAGTDFIKTIHQFHIETIIQHHNICIKLGSVCGVLSFNISIFRLFAKEKTFDNSHTSSIYFSDIDKNYVMPGRKRMVWGNCVSTSSLEKGMSRKNTCICWCTVPPH